MSGMRRSRSRRGDGDPARATHGRGRRTMCDALSSATHASSGAEDSRRCPPPATRRADTLQGDESTYRTRLLGSWRTSTTLEPTRPTRLSCGPCLPGGAPRLPSGSPPGGRLHGTAVAPRERLGVCRPASRRFDWSRVTRVVSPGEPQSDACNAPFHVKQSSAARLRLSSLTPSFPGPAPAPGRTPHSATPLPPSLLTPNLPPLTEKRTFARETREHHANE